MCLQARVRECALQCTSTCRKYICLYMTSHTKTHNWKLYTEKHSILMSMDSGNSNNYKNRAVDFHNFDWHNILPEPQKTFMCLFSGTRFALKVAFNMFKRLYMALIACIFIIVLTNRKVHLPDNNGMLSADALLIHAVTMVYFQYPTRREHWPQYPCFHVKVLHVWWFITDSQFTIHHFISRQVGSFWTYSEWICTMICNIANSHAYHSSLKELTTYKKNWEEITNMH